MKILGFYITRQEPEVIVKTIVQADDRIVSRKVAGQAFTTLQDLYFLGVRHGKKGGQTKRFDKHIEAAHREVKEAYGITVEKRQPHESA
jgi:hypothetical protein